MGCAGSKDGSTSAEQVEVKMSETGFNTIALHHGHKLDSANRARAVPINQSTSFCFKDQEHGKDLFCLAKLGPIYTRIMNPTTHAFEYKVGKLEGAPCSAHGDFDVS